MRPLLSLFSFLLLIFLLPACRKSSSTPKPAGFSGDWKMTQLNGGLAIDVTPLDKDHVYQLQLLSDSSAHYFFNSKPVYTGTWSIRQIGTPPNQESVLLFGDSTGKLLVDTPYAQRGRLIDDKLVITMEPDPSYKAVYSRE
jgi:hypothetical protein